MKAPARITIDFAERDSSLAPFERSAAAVLEVLARNQRADAVFLYGYTEEKRRLWLAKLFGRAQPVTTARIELTETASAWLQDLGAPALIGGAQRSEYVSNFPEVVLNGLESLAVIPARSLPGVNAYVTIGWHEPPGERDLNDAANVAIGLSLILRRTNQSQNVRKLIAQVTHLESELADWKIAERTSGLAAARGSLPIDSELIRQHIARVLDGADEANTLSRRLSELQQELSSRRMIARAKAVLQQKYGMTEQQAYAHLQGTSRRTRRPMSTVARELIPGDDERRIA